MCKRRANYFSAIFLNIYFEDIQENFISLHLQITNLKDSIDTLLKTAAGPGEIHSKIHVI
jgi:hypothetical protein